SCTRTLCRGASRCPPIPTPSPCASCTATRAERVVVGVCLRSHRLECPERGCSAPFYDAKHDKTDKEQLHAAATRPDRRGRLPRPGEGCWPGLRRSPPRR